MRVLGAAAGSVSLVALGIAITNPAAADTDFTFGTGFAQASLITPALNAGELSVPVILGEAAAGYQDETGRATSTMAAIPLLGASSGGGSTCGVEGGGTSVPLPPPLLVDTSSTNNKGDVDQKEGTNGQRRGRARGAREAAIVGRGSHAVRRLRVAEPADGRRRDSTRVDGRRRGEADATLQRDDHDLRRPLARRARPTDRLALGPHADAGRRRFAHQQDEDHPRLRARRDHHRSGGGDRSSDPGGPDSEDGHPDRHARGRGRRREGGERDPRAARSHASSCRSSTTTDKAGRCSARSG